MQMNIQPRFAFLLFPALLLMSCLCLSSCSDDNEDQLAETARLFSDTYFNWQYFRSVDYCTPDSKPWLSYMASQVDESDVEILRMLEERATVEIVNTDIMHGDSVARVKVRVRNYLGMDTIGTKGRVVDKGTFVIPMTRNDGVWRVRLTAPLRALKD